MHDGQTLPIWMIVVVEKRRKAGPLMMPSLIPRLNTIKARARKAMKMPHCHLASHEEDGSLLTLSLSQIRKKMRWLVFLEDRLADFMLYK